MSRNSWIFVSALLVLVSSAAIASEAEEFGAETAFARLAALAGTWQGVPEGHGEAAEAEAEHTPEVTHRFELSAGGTVVMETMNPGHDHEMINMYHVDGEDLLLTHYCAGGNQPRMKLNREQSSDAKLVFDFAGGTNLEAIPEHIHSAEITFDGAGKIMSSWSAYRGDEPAGKMVFHLERGE